ncbi:MAG: hypothetical protein L6R41_001232 [Letrouitia leprolyta]|nr:MAG: hypothetical protein L6R41_001232 [Letrouitia leprolyta]
MEIAEQPPTSPKPLFKKRSTKSTLRKRPATPPPADSDYSGYSSASSSGNRKIKRRRKSAAVTASTKTTSSYPSKPDLSPTKHTGDRTSTLTLTNDATKTSNWFDEKAAEKDNTHPSTCQPPTTTSTDAPDGTYKGTSSYTSYIAKNPNAPTRPGIGPIKAPTNVRTITVTDFAPDVCKDYKQTGFCGFGDSCKFLHAREDYKQGWELDKEWEKVGSGKKGQGKLGGGGQKTAQRQGGEGEEEEDEDALLEGIPFACIICKEGYKDPIVTKCGHYFCEKCALQRYRRSPSCAACGSGTGGVFNGAKGLRKLLERKRERARVRREKALENGEEVESEEESAELDK